ncbi:hypothetical protein DXX98_03315 [Janibacter melonis]|nr:hypothetical protein [Janibacter melonis]
MDDLLTTMRALAVDGLLSAADARACGLDRRLLVEAAARGEIERLARGPYLSDRARSPSTTSRRPSTSSSVTGVCARCGRCSHGPTAATRRRARPAPACARTDSGWRTRRRSGSARIASTRSWTTSPSSSSSTAHSSTWTRTLSSQRRSARTGSAHAGTASSG